MTRPNAEQPAQRGVLSAPAGEPAVPGAVPGAPGAGPAAAPAPATPGTAIAVPTPDALQRAARSVIGGASTVAAVAEAEASAQTLPVAAAATTAAPSGPGGPRDGTVYGRGNGDERRGAPAGRQPRLRIGWHTASLPALASMGVTSPGTGLLLGADHDQKPVPIRFFRSEPTRVTLVGGVWAAQMIAFRALAQGAQVVVMTIEPQVWHGFGERAVSRPDRVVVLHGEQPGVALGTARQPALVIHDLGVAGPVAPPPIGPWQTHMTVLRRLDERGISSLQRCDLLILQRLQQPEATVAETALRLTGQSAHLLQMMEDEMLALIGGGANRYLWLHPTAIERQYVGNPWR